MPRVLETLLSHEEMSSVPALFSRRAIGSIVAKAGGWPDAAVKTKAREQELAVALELSVRAFATSTFSNALSGQEPIPLDWPELHGDELEAKAAVARTQKRRRDSRHRARREARVSGPARRGPKTKPLTRFLQDLMGLWVEHFKRGPRPAWPLAVFCDSVCRHLWERLDHGFVIGSAELTRALMDELERVPEPEAIHQRLRESGWTDLELAPKGTPDPDPAAPPSPPKSRLTRVRT